MAPATSTPHQVQGPHIDPLPLLEQSKLMVCELDYEFVYLLNRVVFTKKAFIYFVDEDKKDTREFKQTIQAQYGQKFHSLE